MGTKNNNNIKEIWECGRKEIARNGKEKSRKERKSKRSCVTKIDVR
jgi:hypothetical protein